MNMYFLIISLIATLFCKQNIDNIEQYSKSNDKNKIYNGKVLDTLCVNFKEGLQLLSQPLKNAEKIANIPYQTNLKIYEYIYSKEINSLKKEWAKVKFNNKFGYVVPDYLKWDCHDHGINSGKKISPSDIIGKFYESLQDNDDYYIEFSSYNTYDIFLYGTCDIKECYPIIDSGNWEIINNYIYMREEKLPYKDTMAYIYLLTEGGSLVPIDADHSFNYKYSDNPTLKFTRK